MISKLNKKILTILQHDYGTPLYLYCLETIEKQYQRVRSLLTNRCEIFYSMKANPLLVISRFLASQNAGCDVSSKNELLVALKAGFDPKKIIFVGPGKSYEELKLCVECDIKAIVCESIDEIVDVDKIAKKHRKKINIIIRLNPDFSVKDAPIKMSGVASQFGIEPKKLIENKDKIRRCENIGLSGLHIYNGSRMLNADTLVENVKNILQLADAMSKQLALDWKIIDIGGGFGIPYFDNEKQLDLQKVISEVNALIENYIQQHPNTTFILELGRYLVAEAGILVSTVTRTKINHGKNFAIIDAGTHCHASSGGSGSFLQRNYLAMHVGQQNKSNNKKIKYQIVGPLCTPNDILLRNVEFSEIHCGDYILIFNVGAYGPTCSPSRFISHGMPAEVIFYKNKFHLVRKRESLENILENQVELNF